MSDECITHKVGDYTVQENGIVRDQEGTIVGRLCELKKFEEQIEQAKRIANNALYFGDNSDYQTALYQVCEALGMDPEEEVGKEFMGEDQ